MSMKVTLSKDLSGIQARFSGAKMQAAQTLLANKVGNDSNVYIPTDTMQMHDSMANASSFEAGEVTWDTSYAATVYEMGQEHIHHEGNRNNNPLASAHWFEVAKSAHFTDWLRYTAGVI